MKKFFKIFLCLILIFSVTASAAPTLTSIFVFKGTSGIAGDSNEYIYVFSKIDATDEEMTEIDDIGVAVGEHWFSLKQDEAQYAKAIESKSFAVGICDPERTLKEEYTATPTLKNALNEVIASYEQRVFQDMEPTVYMPGSGTKDDPYLVSSAAHFAKVSENLSAYYRQTADIATVTTTIGSANTPFAGEYDGNGYSITVSLSGSGTMGLFAFLSGTVKNLSIKGSVVNESPKLGTAAFVGQGIGNGFKIENCTNYASVTDSGKSSDQVAGILGRGYGSANIGTVIGCKNYGDITAGDASGIVGVMSKYISVENCANLGTITGTDRAAGICTWAYGDVSNCYNLGTIKATSISGAAVGILGGLQSKGTSYNSRITNCFNAGKLDADYTFGIASRTIAGIGGSTTDKTGKYTVINCYNISQAVCPAVDDINLLDGISSTSVWNAVEGENIYYVGSVDDTLEITTATTLSDLAGKTGALSISGYEIVTGTSESYPYLQLTSNKIPLAYKWSEDQITEESMNFAFKKSVEVSRETEGKSHSKVTDGIKDISTSAHAWNVRSGDYIIIDLEESREIDCVAVYEYSFQRAKTYTLEISSDRSTWTKVVDVNDYITLDGPSGAVSNAPHYYGVLRFAKKTARYIKLTINEVAEDKTSYIEEIEVYNSLNMPDLTPKEEVPFELEKAQVLSKLPYTAENFHIYLFIGASNMNGRNVVPDNEYLTLSKAFLLNDDGEWEYAQPYIDENSSYTTLVQGYNRYSSVDQDTKNGLNSTTSFARALSDNTPENVGIGIISNACGGTSLDQWSKGYVGTDDRPDYDLYEETVRRTKAAIEKGGTLKGIFYVSPGIKNQTILEQLNTLVTDMRKDIGVLASEVPFIATQMQNVSSRATHNETIKTIASTIENSDYTSNSVGFSLYDSTHFDAITQQKLGILFAEKILAKVYNTNVSYETLYNSLYQTSE